jgi:hypothetical protein
MKREWVSGVVLLLFTACGVSAQEFAIIDLAPAQREYIKDYVLKEKVRPTVVGERIGVGVTIPSSIELRPVPGDWGPSVRRFLYFYSGDRVHFVDPLSRRVVLDVY